MKIAKVVPLFKSGDRHSFNNYRPISLLPQFSKVLEKIFYKRMVKFVEDKGIFHDNQFGFRSKRNTGQAILSLVEDVTDAIEKNSTTAGVFIDFKKAFDTVNHSILLEKLDHYGIRGIAYNWMSSYLCRRKQYVLYDEYKSGVSDIVCGVPQGSILGSLLFLLYINDICNVSSVLKLILFADDTNLFYSHPDTRVITEVLNCELKKLDVWFKLNKLSLNVKKTNYMLFGMRKPSQDCEIQISDCKLDRVFCAKFLGVLIDDKLNWKKHISVVNSKLSKSLSVLYKVSHILDVTLLKMLYFSLVYPYLYYCCEIWGSAYKCSLSCISSTQNKIVRVLAHSSKKCSIAPLYHSLNLLPFESVFRLKICLIMYKASKCMLPYPVQKLFELYDNVKRNGRVFKTKYCKTTLKSHSLSIIGPKVYDSLPPVVKCAPSVYVFKSRVFKLFKDALCV